MKFLIAFLILLVLLFLLVFGLNALGDKELEQSVEVPQNQSEQYSHNERRLFGNYSIITIKADGSEHEYLRYERKNVTYMGFSVYPVALTHYPECKFCKKKGD